MTSIPSLLAVSAVVLMMYVRGGESVQCFECNSHTDVGCELTIPPKQYEKNCSDHKYGASFTFCRKISQIIEFSVNNLPPEKRIIRSCGSIEGNYKNRCYQRSGFGGRQEVCACDKDLCNGAMKIKPTLGFLLAFIVALIARN